jgi:hypothetical protein
MSEAQKKIQPGDTVHVLTTISVPTGDIFAGSFMPERGTEFEVSAAMIEAARDRLGNPGWPALVHDEDGQLAKWGKVVFRAGPAPADLQRWTFGDPAWEEAREIARRAAHAETDPHRRAAALRLVHETYGAAPSTSKHTPAPRESYWAKQAEEQQARRILDGRRVTKSHYSGEDDFMFPAPNDGA